MDIVDSLSAIVDERNTTEAFSHFMLTVEDYIQKMSQLTGDYKYGKI